MPDLPLRACPKPGCLHMINAYRECPDHPPRAPNWDKKKKGKQFYTYKWQQARLVFLRENPLCVICDRAGRIVAASVVDHITPHRGDMGLFWRRTNWQALCKKCHDKKTASGR